MSTVLEKLFEPAKRFLGIIGASVGGITAIFYGFGFLAVQAHHSFLGLTHISVDFNQYLFTGGRFFAYFPTMVVYLFEMTFTLVSLHFEWLLFTLAMFAIFRLLWLISLFRRATSSLGGFIKKFLIRFLTSIQIVFNLILLWLFLSFSLEIVEERNWLFREAASGSLWLLDPSAQSSNIRQQHFAKLLIIAALSIFVLIGLENLRTRSAQKKSNSKKPIWRSILSIPALFLVALQVLYLPVNYGILLLPNKYPMVEVALHDAELARVLEPLQPLVLLHREGDDYFFYSPEKRKIWQFHRNELSVIIRMHEANIFKDQGVITRKE